MIPPVGGTQNSQTYRHKSRMMVVRNWKKREMGCYCLMDIELQFCEIKRVTAMESGDSCTIL